MPSALTYIHSVGERQGRYDRRVTTSQGTTSTLICADYVNSTYPSSEFGNFAVLIEDGACVGQVGFVTPSGLAKATGTLTVADPFSDGLIADGVTFSLYDGTRLPPIRKGSRPGLLELANRALELVSIERTLTVAGVSGQIHYTIDPDAYPWWTDDTRIIDVQRPVASADDASVAIPRESWDWLSDGETRKLVLRGAPFQTGQSFTIKVMAPGNSRLRLRATARASFALGEITAITAVLPGYYLTTPTVTISGGGGTGATATATLSGTGVASYTVTAGGTGYTTVPEVTVSAGDWADQTSQTAGLRGIADEAIPDVRIVRPMMLALVYAELAEMGAPGFTVAEWLAKAADWERRAVAIRANRAPKDRHAGVIRLRGAAFAGRGR